jgi:tripartite-type tricarboxylate transporter receptor subunit TctC
MRKTVLAALIALLTFGGEALAQGYPSRAITMIVPYAAGGPSDAIARIMAERMKLALGQAVLVENVTGAGGSIGVARAVHSPPDGYTISFGHLGTHVANAVIYKLNFDLLNDFEPLVILPIAPMVIVSNNSVPAKNLTEFIAWLKAKPTPAAVGTAGAGSASHLAALLLESVTGAKLQYVPYRGTGPAMNDLIAGQIDLIVDQTSNALQQVRAGNIRAYGVTDKKRLAAAPDVPTTAEAGSPALYMSLWSGLWMPKGTPKDIIAKLNAAAMESMTDPAVRKQFENLGLEIPAKNELSPEALGALQRSEKEKWWPIVKAANVSVN